MQRTAFVLARKSGFLPNPGQTAAGAAAVMWEELGHVWTRLCLAKALLSGQPGIIPDTQQLWLPSGLLIDQRLAVLLHVCSALQLPALSPQLWFCCRQFSLCVQVASVCDTSAHWEAAMAASLLPCPVPPCKDLQRLPEQHGKARALMGTGHSTDSTSQLLWQRQEDLCTRGLPPAQSAIHRTSGTFHGEL